MALVLLIFSITKLLVGGIYCPTLLGVVHLPESIKDLEN